MDQDDAQLRLLIQAKSAEWDRKFRQMQDALHAKDAAIEEARNRADMRAYISTPGTLGVSCFPGFYGRGVLCVPWSLFPFGVW